MTNDSVIPCRYSKFDELKEILLETDSDLADEIYSVFGNDTSEEDEGRRRRRRRRSVDPTSPPTDAPQVSWEFIHAM